MDCLVNENLLWTIMIFDVNAIFVSMGSQNFLLEKIQTRFTDLKQEIFHLKTNPRVH